MSNRRFEALPHTADKGIKAYGKDLKELFENAAFGMFSLMAPLENYTPTEARDFEVEGEDVETLLRNWLAELLYFFEVDRILFVNFRVHTIEGCGENTRETLLEKPCRLKGTAWGLPFNEGIEWLGSAVKAVTHHGLYVKKEASGFEAQIIFDV